MDTSTVTGKYLPVPEGATHMRVYFRLDDLTLEFVFFTGLIPEDDERGINEIRPAVLRDAKDGGA